MFHKKGSLNLLIWEETTHEVANYHYLKAKAAMKEINSCYKDSWSVSCVWVFRKNSLVCVPSSVTSHTLV